MNTRKTRLADLAEAAVEIASYVECGLTAASIEEELPLAWKKINSILDDEFVAGYDYHADPTAPLLPGRSQPKALYGATPRRGPGRPRKNPELPPRPAGKHISDQPDPDDDQSEPLPSAEQSPEIQ